jgi:ATP-dependent Lhr-like helicase
MEGFDRLSAALQVQIVNGLGWQSLRPVQDLSIQTILDGHNCVILAPTAGGKTEASLFPLLSLMDTEDRAPTSVLYLAPIRALLNNQEARLEKLTGLIGRTATKWHGDVGQSARKRFIRNPTDILAITPESLEAMLMSTSVPGQRLLAKVRAVIIDEVHSFAASDRGAHLMSLIERIQRLSGYDIQRIGLSATVGDPEAIAAWLGGSSAREHVVVDPRGAGTPPEVQLDYVGSLANAAHVIDKLYPGTRRLVFVDSRRRVEELGSLLLARGVDTFVTHSSLALSERTAAERAFEERDNCVIVATSALELGIDVGDLDRVIQIDAPSTVSSFLQRMGRTGRRPGTRANCTFLATSDDAVVQGAALLHLWSQGFVEPTHPNHRATHILAHQLIALGIQNLGVGTADWWQMLEGCAAFEAITPQERTDLVQHMLDQKILAELDSRFVLGQRGEQLYGWANFRELYAVFSAPPILKVLHGRQEIGSVDAWFAQQDTDDKALAFVLGGRPWKVTYIDWKRGICHVQPSDSGSYPRWMGRPVLLSEALCNAMRTILKGDHVDPAWSNRAKTVIDELREAYLFLDEGDAPLVSDANRVRWWTFAGGKTNNLLAALLKKTLGSRVSSNNLCVTLAGDAALSDVAIRQAIRELPPKLTWDNARTLAPTAARGRVSKFQPCLPVQLELDLLARTLLDVEGARRVAGVNLTHIETTPGAEAARGELPKFEVYSLPPEPRPPEPRPDAEPRIEPRLQPSIPVTYIDTFDALDQLAPKLMKADYIAFDVETTFKRELCLAQVGTHEGIWLIDAVAIDDISPLARVLESARVTKIIQYAHFERSVMSRLGIEIENVFDTWQASKKRHGKKVMGGHNLAALCRRELNIEIDKGEQTSDWRQRPLSTEQLHYAALDVEVLLKLYQAFNGAA